MIGDVTVSDLRDVPEFADTIADRVWREWQRAGGITLAAVAANVRRALGPGGPAGDAAGGLPFVLVAHDGAAFAGTASGIVSDMDERPDYAPWVAALWVEPAWRARGIGADLALRVAARCFRLGHRRVYLSAAPHVRGFYAARGWAEVETGIGPQRLTVFARERPP